MPPTPQTSLVNYRMPGGEMRPALITRRNDDGSVNLHVFTDGPDEAREVPARQVNVAAGDGAGEWSHEPTAEFEAPKLAAAA